MSEKKYFLLHPLLLFPLLLFTSLLTFQPATVSAAEQLDPDTQLHREMYKYLVCFPMDQLGKKKNRPVITQKDVCLATIYQKRKAKPIWVTPDGPGEQAYIVKKHLHGVTEHGLEPHNYQLAKIESLWGSRSIEDLAELDTLLTYNLVKYIHDIGYGQIKPLEKNPKLFAEAGDQTFNPVNAIDIALGAADLNRFLSELPPTHHHYRSLQAALTKYRQLHESGGWPQLAQGESLYPGDVDPRVILLRQRLQLTGDYPPYLPSSHSAFYSQSLEEAVLQFQRRNGLEVDGIVGPKTTAALNITAAERVNIIKMNLARWRWQSHSLGQKYVLVNIAAFRLKAYENDGEHLALDIPVIVGKRQNQTPVFSDRIKYIDINPYWNVPTSIARNKELPELRKNPNHLVERNVRLFSSWQEGAVELDSTTIDWHTVSRSQMSGFKLRQDPGPWNALGKIKFVFPNRYSVYMHDTPKHDLFQETERSFSHGCIRVSDPLALAQFTLKDQGDGWGAEQVARVYQRTSRKVIRLQTPLPVHITYQTAWVDKDGMINFNNDIYARDKELHNALLQ